MLVEDVSHTTQTSSIMFVTIHINIVNIARLLMIVDADHVLQIGRSIATHVIVIARLLWIISIHHTPIIALIQREYFDAERQKSEMLLSEW
jgi:hypothetical protein